MTTMTALLERTIDFFREALGQPIRLRHLLADYPDIRIDLNTPTVSIALRDVVRWDELDSEFRLSRRSVGSLLGWRLHGRHYSSFNVKRPEFDSFGNTTRDDVFTCDIRSVQGLYAAKSDLSKYSSMDQWIQAESPELIATLTLDQLAKNMAHREIRVGCEPGSDYFCRYAWDGRLFLVNTGGAHHLGAARYIASRIDQPVELRAPLYVRSINRTAVESLRKDFEIFMLPEAHDISNEFHDVMGTMGVTWLWHGLPHPFKGCRAVYLPRSEAKSMQVAVELSAAGVADVGRHWSMLLSNQSRFKLA